MGRKALYSEITEKQSFLCVGLDTDLTKIPEHLLKEEDPVFEFNKQIIDATSEYCVAYKPNIAFYERLGPKGWNSLEKTINYIPENILTIADAKRGDIGNTAEMYAQTFFEQYQFDAITVAPYMGEDSVTPFLRHPGKWAIILGLTSNKGSEDFQFIVDQGGKYLFENVLEKAIQWGTADNTMFVVGATQDANIKKVRDIASKHFFLVPGIGAQGGSLRSVCKYGMNESCGLLVNSSRGIIYAGKGEDFAEVAGREAKALQQEMKEILNG